MVDEDLTGLDDSELEARIQELQGQMRPLEQRLAELRARRDLLLTERRRRQRQAQREHRSDVRAAMRGGRFPTFAELVAASDQGSFEDYAYHLKTGGEVRLGFPGARRQQVAMTDGSRIVHASDLAETARLYAAGWELGSPGRPGVRVHFPGTRQERLVEASELYVRPAAPEPSSTKP
jgi:TolA-binding protein